MAIDYVSMLLVASVLILWLVFLRSVFRTKALVIALSATIIMIVLLSALALLSVLRQTFFEKTFYLENRDNVFSFDTPWYADLRGEYTIGVYCPEVQGEKIILTGSIVDSSNPDNIYRFSLICNKVEFQVDRVNIIRPISQGNISLSVNRKVSGLSFYIGRKL